MDLKKLTLKILPNRLAVCRLNADAPLPDWIDESDFSSVTRTEAELTIVCDEVLVASGTTSETGWRCIKVEGPLDFSEIGIVLSLTQPLAESGVAVFLISTFDTDYLMVKEKDLANAIDALSAQGHQVKAED
ncbi:MAG: ACT domain-containing protein [Desulfobacterales bacterium]|nr:ACT domain-containing protein [Desulfobacterales bacterium]